METEIKVIGNHYSQYGPSTFFKGLRITKTDVAKARTLAVNENGLEGEITHETDSTTFIIAMGDCVPVRPWQDSPIECLAEVRMIWRDKTEQTCLLSLRLYFLPENTSKGRVNHGEDEVVAVKDLDSPKGRIVIRAEDFSSWLVDDLKWNWGLKACYNDTSADNLISPTNGILSTSLLSNSKLDFAEVEKEKIKDNVLHSNVTILSYSRYCRYRATLKRLERFENNQMRVKLIETLSGFVASQPNTRIMFAKETIDYPDLESHEMLCPHLAPKLIGKQRGRRKKNINKISEFSPSSPAPSSEFSVDSSGTNDSDAFDGKHLMKNSELLNNTQRLTRNKLKSESGCPDIYTTLSTGRVSKQRLPLTPIKSATNKKRRKAEDWEDDDSSTDDDQDEDYDDKYIKSKLKKEVGGNRQLSKDGTNQDDDSDGKMGLTPNYSALHIPMETTKTPEELEFLIRLNTFMAERSSAYPKLIWGLRDVNLFTIYTRVQKLGGFDAIADNRVWKNLFEDLSEPGKCITQGMTKRKYERILLPFERYERELRENDRYPRSELTISTVSKNSTNHRSPKSHRMTLNRRRSTSPAIEIIPLKNGGAESAELTLEQITEIQNIIKPKDSDHQQYYSGNSNDGLSLPVHVIVRPNAKSSIFPDLKRKRYEEPDRTASSRSIGGQQKPKEKENIPLGYQTFTTIMPLTRDGIPTSSRNNVVDLVGSDDDADYPRGSGSHPQAKKQKLDILREGGLEVTPISRRSQDSLHLEIPTSNVARTFPQVMQPNVSLMSLTPVRAPPVIQSLNMYQSTRQVFKDPKEDVMIAAMNVKPYCLDLTSKRHQNNYHQQERLHQPYHLQSHLNKEMPRESHKTQLSIEEVQRSYRGSNPDLQITLVKPQQESPSSSTSSYVQKEKNGYGKSFRTAVPSPKKHSKNIASPSLSGIPPLNPVIIAAANELQKLQQQNMPMFPFLSGLDITPMQQSLGASSSTKKNSAPNVLDPNLMNYLSALYGNPLLQGNNLLSNMSPAAEFMKIMNNASSTNNRIPSSKN